MQLECPVCHRSVAEAHTCECCGMLVCSDCLTVQEIPGLAMCQRLCSYCIPGKRKVVAYDKSEDSVPGL